MKRESVQCIVVAVALLFSILGNLGVCWVEWNFYEEMAKLPRGTGIRAMQEGFDELSIAFATFILAVPISIVGIYYSIKHRRFVSLILLLLAIVLSLAPIPLGIWLTRNIIAATGVVAEP